MGGGGGLYFEHMCIQFQLLTFSIQYLMIASHTHSLFVFKQLTKMKRMVTRIATSSMPFQHLFEVEKGVVIHTREFTIHHARYYGYAWRPKH